MDSYNGPCQNYLVHPATPHRYDIDCFHMGQEFDVILINQLLDLIVVSLHVQVVLLNKMLALLNHLNFLPGEIAQPSDFERLQ